MWGLFKWFRANNDPAQQELADVLADGLNKEMMSGIDASSGVALYVMGQPWSEKEASWRLLHAAMLIAKQAPTLEHQADGLAKRAIGKLNED